MSSCVQCTYTFLSFANRSPSHYHIVDISKHLGHGYRQTGICVPFLEIDYCVYIPRVATYKMITKKRARTTSSLRYTVHALTLTQADRHGVQLDPNHVPSPKLVECSVFDLAIHERIQ